MSTSSPRGNVTPTWVSADYQAVLEAAPDAMIVVNRSGEVVAANLQAEVIFQYRREQLIGMVVESLIPARFRGHHESRRENFFSDPQVRRMGAGLDLFALRSDGTEVPVDVSLSPLITESGDFVIGAIRDATERRQAEEFRTTEAILRGSEERFRLVADAAPALIWMSDVDKLCVYFNKTWLDFTGRPIEEEIGNGWLQGVHPDDLQRCLDTYIQYFDRREKFRMEYRLRRYDGVYRWILDIGTPRFDQGDVFAGYIGIAVDVSERKAAEEALLKSEEKFSKAFRRSPIAFTLTSAIDDRYLDVNETFEHLTGWKREEVIGRTPLDISLWVDPTERVEAVRRLLTEGAVRNIEFRCRHKDGTERVGLGSAELIQIGNELCVLSVSADITERKQAEEALSGISRKLVRAQEQERARIARELHDDINQRLALLAIELQQLREQSPASSPEVRRRIEKLQQGIRGISADVQALSHELHSSRLEYLGLTSGMKGWCKEFGDHRRVEIDFKSHDVPTNLPSEISFCLFRVLQEALQNAAKHSGVKQFEVRLAGVNDEINLTISDQGVGFDVEAAMKGRGLGLTSMRERLRLINGQLSIDSQPRRGTTIHARVPFSTTSSSAQTAG